MGQLTTNSDRSKVFIWDNRFSNFVFTAGGSPVTLIPGQLMGRISATQKVALLASAAVDGSQFPIGIVNEDRVVAAGETVTIALCIAGDVAKEKVILQGADTMATVISGRSIEDRISTDTTGIILVASTELTGYDNQ